MSLSYEPRHVKGADQLLGSRAADERLCFRYIDTCGTYSPSSSYLIRNFKPLTISSVALQPSLCRTWSETPNTDFFVTWLILSVCGRDKRTFK